MLKFPRVNDNYYYSSLGKDDESAFDEILEINTKALNAEVDVEHHKKNKDDYLLEKDGKHIA